MQVFCIPGRSYPVSVFYVPEPEEDYLEVNMEPFQSPTLYFKNNEGRVVIAGVFHRGDAVAFGEAPW